MTPAPHEPIGPRPPLLRRFLGGLAFIAVMLASLTGSLALCVLADGWVDGWVEGKPELVQKAAWLVPTILLCVGISIGGAIAMEASNRIIRPRSVARRGPTLPRRPSA